MLTFSVMSCTQREGNTHGVGRGDPNAYSVALTDTIDRYGLQNKDQGVH